jgi:hypothetical protein
MGVATVAAKIGRERCAMAPAIVRRIERTAAKIGRPMKKWENRTSILRREIGLFSLQPPQ